MTRATANFIANEFFKDMNPTFWNGEGEQPDTFDSRIWEYPLKPRNLKMRLDISLVNNEIEGWCHYCELVDEPSNDMVECLSGYGIDSKLNLVDTIMDLCKGFA